MSPSVSETFSSEMEIDFDENGLPIVGKHKIETGNVDSRLTAMSLHEKSRNDYSWTTSWPLCTQILVS